MAKIKRNPAARELAKIIMSQYDPQSSKDLDEALKEVFGTAFEEMLQAEMDEHLGYSNNSKEPKETENRRNGYGKKTLKTTHGEVPVQVPRDRDGSFKPEILPKRQRDVSGIEDKVISMYARGMSQRDISKTVEEIYGFSISHEMVSKITDRILPDVQEWKNRPLKSCYAFLFVDCLYVSLRNEGEAMKLQSTSSLAMTSKAERRPLAYGSVPRKARTSGCRFLMKSRRAASKMSFLSVWTAYPGWNREPKRFFPKSWCSTASCT